MTVATVLVASLLSGCGGDASHAASGGLPKAGTELVGNPDNRIEVTNGEATRAKTWIYGSFPLCLDDHASADTIRLTGVKLLKAQGLALVASGVKDLKAGQDGVGGLPGPLPADYRPVSGLDFGTRCSSKDRHAEVVLELRRTGTGTGTMAGFAILYRTDKGERSVRYDATITLCVDDNRTVCREAQDG